MTNFKNYSQNYLFVLAMVYSNVNIASTALVYKIVAFGPVVITAGALLSPLWYLIGDIVAEVYGYKQARKVIWTGLACELLFIILCVFLIKLPSPVYWNNQQAYDIVLGNLPRVFIGSIVGTLSGSFLNAYLISKWKVIVRGKYFLFRSMICNIIGQLIFSIVTAFTDLLGVIPTMDVWKVIFVSYGTKVCILPLFAIPVAVFVIYLKKWEGSDLYYRQSILNNSDYKIAQTS